MKRISSLDRAFLLGTCLLAAYQISTDLDGLNSAATWGLTVGFGTLLVAGLLLIILGLEGLDRQAVVIVSTLIPLSISFGLISLQLPTYSVPYLVFSVGVFLLITVTRFTASGKAAALMLAFGHGIAGITITFLPAVLFLQGKAQPGYLLVSLGGGLMGLGGLSLTFLRAGKPLIPQEKIFAVLPGLLFLMTAALIGGFSFQ